jgi:uncharacterized protein YaaQ
MKMLLTVVNNDDSGALNNALVKGGFCATKLATTGGFIKAGNTTFLIGVADEKVDEVFAIISKTCKKRREVVPSAIFAPYDAGIYTGLPVEVTVGGAAVFVINVERFEKL